MVNSGLKETAIGVVGDGIKQAVENEAETASASVLASNPAEILNIVSSGSETEETVYSYDANGNQVTKTTSEKTETYTYDGLNQLVGFTDGDTAASYAYNVSGLRIEKTVDGETINHVWDGSKQIVADIVDNDFYEADCYLRGTNLVAKYNYCNGVKSEYTYYTQNAHGDVVNLTDETGAVTKSYTYDAFGVEQNIDDSDTNAFRYCGEYFDAETGTVYLRARYYDPSIGRFISRDSYAGKNEEPLSLNRYTYCHNNPIIGTDPSGHVLVIDDIIYIAIAVLLVADIALLSYSASTSYGNSFSDPFSVPNFNEPWALPGDDVLDPPISFAVPDVADIPQDQAIDDAKVKEDTVSQKKSYSVYKLVDDDNVVQYVGRTSNIAKTEYRHSQNPYRKDFDLQVIHSGLSYEQCRGLEQYYITFYGTLNKLNSANNQINGVSMRNKKRYETYMKAAGEYITQVNSGD